MKPIDHFRGGRESVREKLNQLVDAVNAIRSITGDSFIAVDHTSQGTSIRLLIDSLLPKIPKVGAFGEGTSSGGETTQTGEMRFFDPNVLADGGGWLTAEGGEQVEQLIDYNETAISGPVTVTGSGGITVTATASTSGKGGTLTIDGSGVTDTICETFCAVWRLEDSSVPHDTYTDMNLVVNGEEGDIGIMMPEDGAVIRMAFTAHFLPAHNVGDLTFRVYNETTSTYSSNDIAGSEGFGQWFKGAGSMEGPEVNAGDNIRIRVQHTYTMNTYMAVEIWAAIVVQVQRGVYS